MRKSLRALSLILSAAPLAAQEAGAGFSLPSTVTFGVIGTHRLATKNPAADFPLNETRIKPGLRRRA